MRQGAIAHGVPPEFLAHPLLADACAVVGRTARIELKDGWHEYPVLWMATVAPPGTGKTPAAKTAHQPLKALQQDAKRHFDSELEAYDLDLAEWEAAGRARKAGKAGQPRGKRPRRPVFESYYSADATTEALAEMLQFTPGVALQRDELIGWVVGFDAYRSGRGGDRQNALSSWSSSALKVDRKSKDSIIVDTPVITIAGGIQPDVLPELATEARPPRWLPRAFLWSYPDSKVPAGLRTASSRASAAAVEAAFKKLRPLGI